MGKQAVWIPGGWWNIMETTSNGNISELLAICAEIRRSPVNSPHKGQCRGALTFSLVCAWINGWVNNGEAGDLRRHRAHYGVTVINVHKVVDIVLSLNSKVSKCAELMVAFVSKMSKSKQFHTDRLAFYVLTSNFNLMDGWITCGYTVYPKKYAHGFVVLCFVVVMQSFIMNSHEVFIHIRQGCFAGTGAIVRLPQCQWSKPDGYGKISQCITTTKHSKAKTVCIFLGIYCTSWCLLKCFLM